MRIDTENILGYSVDTRGLDRCVAEAMNWIESGNGARWLACINPHAYAVALDDRSYSDALHGADWLIPDGVGIVIASRLLKGRIRDRVTGSDVFWSIQEEMNRKGGFKVFFLGSTERTLKSIRERVSADFPRLQVVGTYSPPFTTAYSQGEIDYMVALVNATSPDVLWVGMTAPKQEKWICANHARLNVKFIGAVGAVFDFYSGQIRRSHPVFQKLGLEWLPRLLQEPRRLWRRMLISAPIFTWHVLRKLVIR